MGRLTETNYQSRIIKLDQHLKAATRAYEDAAFKHELETSGTGTSEDVAQAHAAMVELTQRRQALDSAWARTKQEIEAECIRSDKAARKVVAAQVEASIQSRAKLAAEMEAAANALIASFKAYEQAGRAIIDAAVPYRVDIGGDILHLREDIMGDFGSPAPLVAGMLKAGGVDFSHVDWGSAAYRVAERGVVPFVELHNDRIRARVAGIGDPRADAYSGSAAA